MARSIRRRLGDAIRDRREQLKLTQEAAAHEAGVSPRYWRALEVEEPSAGLEIIEKVMTALAWTWKDLVEILSPTTTDDGSAPARVRSLLDEAWRRATPRERELVQATLRVLASGRRAKT